MNEKNLIQKAWSQEEAKRYGQKGGQASAKARQKKKAMRDAAEMILSLPAAPPKQYEKMLDDLGVDLNEVDVQFLSLFAVAAKAMKGDSVALTFLRDTAGEKPVDKANLTHEMAGDFVLEIVEDDQDAENKT